MQKFSISGMSCSACVARVEKAVKEVRGVESCAVNLITNSMSVDGDFCVKDVVDAVEKAGYKAVVDNFSDKTFTKEQQLNQIRDTQTPKLKRNLIWSIGFLLVLMYISMGRNMFSFPLPSKINENAIALAVIQLVLSLIVLIINRAFFINGTKSLFKRAPNMDTLVAMGSFVSFAYSVAITIKIIVVSSSQSAFEALLLVKGLYFESSAMIVTLITVGKMLEASAKGKTTNAIKGLIELAPQTATLLVDEKEVVVGVEQVKMGDIFVVKPGESIAVDGVIISGTTTINASSLTGESLPEDKVEGDEIFSGTINISGYITCRATRVGVDTTLSQIIRLVSDAQATKAPIAKTADKVSGIFVPAVLAISLITFIVWIIATSGDLGFSLARAISVLVISCPCALGLATPVAIMVGSGVGAKNKILFKSAISLETIGKTQIIALDKTGTITKGEPSVTDVICYDDSLLETSFSLERKSEHPLSRAIIEYCLNNQVTEKEVNEFSVVSGQGLVGKIENKAVYGGNLAFIAQKVQISDEAKSKAKALAESGKTPMLFASEDKLLGIIAVSDSIKDDSLQAVRELKNLGIRVIMLTGDNENTAKEIARQAEIDEVVAGVLPSGKEQAVSALMKQGCVMMVGDGINDAPSLTRADVGVAIGAGTDVAIDSADVVLMKSSLTDAVKGIRIGRATLKTIKQNLFWAFIYNIIGIPLAAGVWYPLFGLTLNPMIGAAAMSLSSFCVCINALRLNFIKPDSSKRDKKIKQREIKEIEKMQKTIKIEGMMCPHCSNRVKGILEAFSEIDSAVVSHEQGTAVIELNKEIDDKLIKTAIENEGYKVIG